MDEMTIAGEMDTAYQNLKRTVMEDRYRMAVPKGLDSVGRQSGRGGVLRPARETARDGKWLAGEFDDNPILKQAAELREKVDALRVLRTHDSSKAADAIDTRLNKAWAFLIDAFELIGIRNKKYADELIIGDGEWLDQATALLDKKDGESHALALSLLWLCLLAAEEHYHRREYEQASASVEKIWELIKEHLERDERLHRLVLSALTEEIILKRKLSRGTTMALDQRGAAGVGLAHVPARSNWKLIAKGAPEHAEDLLSLLGRLGLTEGKIAIRRAHFSRADKSLEQCLRSTSAWCQLKLWRLALSGLEESSEEVIQTKNFALCRTAVAQSYLAFGYQRRGRFRRAITQIIPARFTLERSHWVLTKIFADMIRADAERRLAGIHNEEHVREVIELCEKTISFFDASLLSRHIKKYSPRRPDKNGERDPSFLLRACYEIGTSFYYLAEIKEKQGLEEEMGDYLSEADRYAGIILNYYLESGTHGNSEFWLANAHHLKAFVAMKRPAGRAGENGREVRYANAIRIIESAVEHARRSKGKWLLTETLTDYAYILNASARYYDGRAREIERRVRTIEEKLAKGGKRRGAGEATRRTVTGGAHLLKAEKDGLLVDKRKMDDKRRELATRALSQLKEAWKVAEEMALEENLSDLPSDVRQSRLFSERGKIEKLHEPRSNFSGPIYLYRADSYALLGNKVESDRAYKNWLEESDEVEFSRVKDLSDEVGEHVEGISPTLIFDGERDDLNFDTNYDTFRDWLVSQALVRGGTDARAKDLLGVSKATFYLWKNKLREKKKSTGSERA